MTPQLIAVDATALENLQNELAELKALIQSVHITPPAKWITVAEHAKHV